MVAAAVPTILFVCTNGAGLGHLTRCLSYARRLKGRARSVFLSLASAIEIIESMGFEADYFVSPNWTANASNDWNSELALRLGLLLDHVQPSVIVFDGTWPYQGFMAASRLYGRAKRVWSRRGLMKSEASVANVSESEFDLIIIPGELDEDSQAPGSMDDGRLNRYVSPVTILDDDELVSRNAARDVLGLSPDARYALFSLGAGNLNDIAGLGRRLIRSFSDQGVQAVWARPSISLSDIELPSGVMDLSVFPLSRYLKGFDFLVGAAGYNTCCEAVQAGIPTLLVPNEQTAADDQGRRANMVMRSAPAVVSACATEETLDDAVRRLMALRPRDGKAAIHLDGAQSAANEILRLAEGAR